MKLSKRDRESMQIANRMAQGMTQGEISDLLEIRRLNVRSTNAWERANSFDGGTAYQERLDKVQDRAWERAQIIASANKWEIDAPGLWWQIKRIDPSNGHSYDVALTVW